MMKLLKRTDSARRQINWWLTIIIQLAKKLLSWVNFNYWDFFCKLFSKANYLRFIVKVFEKLWNVSKFTWPKFHTLNWIFLKASQYDFDYHIIYVKYASLALTYFQPLLLTFASHQNFYFISKNLEIYLFLQDKICASKNWRLKS